MATNEGNNSRANTMAMATSKSAPSSSTNNNVNNSSIQSLTQCLEQIASLSSNPQQFESQKKQFFEQFSVVFGSLPNNVQQRANPAMDTSNTTKQTVVPSIPVQLQSVNNNSSSNLVSVPLSIISNASHASHASSIQTYQYPYLTSGPNPLTNVPSLQNSQSYSYSNSLPPSHIVVPSTAMNNMNISNININKTPTNINNYCSLISPASSINSPQNGGQTAQNNMTAYESYWMRRILSNILLLFFRYHPNGVLECELSGFYEAMFDGEKLALTMDLKYLLCVHKSITITNTKERGKLYTLNDAQMACFLQEFDSSTLQTWIIKHIRRLFRCFPNGIAVDCLQDLLYNMVEFKLSAIVGSNWQQFVGSIEHMYCIDVGGIATFIYAEIEDLGDEFCFTNTDKIGYYLSQFLDPKNVLKRPVGYCELLIVLLAQHCQNGVGIDGETLEKAFHEQYQSRLVHEAPFIADVLSKICQTSLNANSEKTKLFKLTPSSKTYFDTQPEAFAPILNRNLTLLKRQQQTQTVPVIVNPNIPNIQTPQAMQVMQVMQQAIPNNNGNIGNNNNGNSNGNMTNGNHNVNNVNHNNANSEDNEGVLKSPFQEDHVSVFMGGFGHGTSVEDLRVELEKLGICMISSSGISYRNYGWSFVTLVNAQQADFLVKRSPIQIGGRSIDVRPFINRQRVKNHIENKPTKDAMLSAMIELLNEFTDGLTVSNVQSRLFRTFSYRIDGPELTKLIGDHPTKMFIRRHGTERIRLTPAYTNDTIEEFGNKMEKLWNIISNNYRGNLYAHFDTPKDGTQKDNDDDNKEQYVISVIDLENEFARKYKCAITADKFGFSDTKELMLEMQKRFDFPFKVISHFHSRSRSRDNEHFRNKPYYNKHQYAYNKYQHSSNNNDNNNNGNNFNKFNGNSNNNGSVNGMINKNGMNTNNGNSVSNVYNINANTMMANQYMASAAAAASSPYQTITSPNPLLTYQQYMSAATNQVSPYNYLLNATNCNSVGNYSYLSSVPNSIISNQSVSNNNNGNPYLNINAFAVSYNNNANKQKI